MVRFSRENRGNGVRSPRKFRFESLEQRELLAADLFYAAAGTTYTPVYTASLETTVDSGPTSTEVYDNELSPGSPAMPTMTVEGGVAKIIGTNQSDAQDNIRVDFIYGGQLIRFSLQLRDSAGNVLGEETRIFVATAVQSIRFDGYAGNDTFINNTNRAAYVNGGYGNDTIISGSGNDVIHGNGGNDFIVSNGGNDRVYGDGGNDNINAGSGADTVDGGSGNDRIDGNSGNDYIWGGYDNDTISGGDGYDTIRGGAGNDHLSGNGHSDVIYGDSGHDQIFGGGGNDVAYGGSGNDTMYGQSGNDTLRGNSGRDLIFGGLGNDYLDGSKDGYLDSLYGGAGADSFADHSARWWEFWRVGEVDHNGDYDYGEGDRFRRF